jgi:hypothetical protein
MQVEHAHHFDVWKHSSIDGRDVLVPQISGRVCASVSTSAADTSVYLQRVKRLSKRAESQ